MRAPRIAYNASTERRSIFLFCSKTFSVFLGGWKKGERRSRTNIKFSARFRLCVSRTSGFFSLRGARTRENFELRRSADEKLGSPRLSFTPAPPLRRMNPTEYIRLARFSCRTIEQWDLCRRCKPKGSWALSHSLTGSERSFDRNTLYIVMRNVCLCVDVSISVTSFESGRINFELPPHCFFPLTQDFLSYDT